MVDMLKNNPHLTSALNMIQQLEVRLHSLSFWECGVPIIAITPRFTLT